MKQQSGCGRNLQKLLKSDSRESVIGRRTAGAGLPAAGGVIQAQSQRGLRANWEACMGRPVGAGGTCRHGMDRLFPACRGFSGRSSNRVATGVHAMADRLA